MLIPKTIHYVWVGPKPLPTLAKKCIQSWKKYMPDCEIIEWSEKNFDISQNRYCREAYEAKKYAFVSDYIRIAVLYQHGGIYMDTDVELTKPLAEEFFSCESFSGYETENTIPTGIMGSVPQQKLFGEILHYYEHVGFVNPDGTFHAVTNVKIITDLVKELGFVPDGKKQTIQGFTVYPQTFFCPLSHDTNETCFSENTYAIHHFSGSWCDRKTRFVGKWNHGMGQTCECIGGKYISSGIYRIVYNICRVLDALFEE